MAAYTIPLQVQGPNIEPADQSAARAMSMAESMQRRQMNDQQIQQAKIQTQQAQQAQKDQEIMRQAYMEGNGDLEKTLDLSIKRGASPNSIAALQQHAVAVKKSIADSDEATLKATAARHDQLAGRLVSMPENLTDQDWLAQVERAHKDRLLTDAEYQQTLQQHQTAPSVADRKMMANGFTGYSKLVDQDLKQREIANTEKLGTASVAKTNAELPGLTAKSDQETRANVASQLGPKAELSKDDYARAWYGLDPKVAAQFPHPDTYDPKKTPATIRQLGQTSEQQVTAGQTAERIEIAKKELEKAGGVPELARRAAGTGPQAEEAKRAIRFMTDQKVEEEVNKQLGVFNALTGGGSPTGSPAAPGGVQIPSVAPGQPDRVQLAAKNNNPGNLKFAKQPGAELGEGGFAKFETPEAGLAALQAQIRLDASRPGTTLESYIAKYAPPNENDTAGYVQKAAAALGVDPKQPLGKIDAAKLAAFQAKQESSTQVTPAAAPGTAPGDIQQPAPQPGGRNDSALQKVNPGIATEVRAVADGRLPLWPTSRMNPMNEVKRNLLMQYDPAFDFTNTAARTKTAQGFSPSGQQGQAINAFDTALRHASVLSDLIDNLDNTNFRKYNSIANWLSSETGSPEVKRFDNVRHKFAEELTKAWRGTGGNESDIKAEMDALNSADSPRQLKKVMSDNVELLQGKMGALEDQYKQTMNKPGNFISPTAQKAIDKLRGGAAAPGAPKKGDKQNHNGDAYVFDGDVWRRQAAVVK